MTKNKTPKRPKTLLWMLICMMISSQVFSQGRRITGTVTANTTNEPLVSATVTVKGTTRFTTTDEKGKFGIEATNNDVLVISSIGFNSREIKVGSSTNLNLGVSQQNVDQK